MNKMQKKFLVLFFIIILSISSISAGWFSDFFSKITGKTSDVNAVVCTDSDGGRDYYKRGSVYGYCYDCTNPLVIGSNSDHCADANNLREFYCTDSQGWIREVVNCPNGCKDGACKKEPIQNITCTDSDGRENYYVKGKTSLGPNNYVDYCNKEGMVDECYDPNCYLNEYYCYSPTIMGQKSDIVCPYGCKNGACIKESIQNITCTDSDGKENYYVKGKTSLGPNNYVDYCNKEGIVDECYDPNCYLNEYYCYSPTIMGQKSDIVCPYGCKNGACIKESIQNITCTDSDGGENYYVKGTAYSKYGETYDCCKTSIDAGPCSNSGPYLSEAFCDSNNKPALHAYLCPYECQDGACLNEPGENITCIDSDGGENYYINGTATVYQGNQWLRDFTDTCATNNILIEGYCNNSDLSTQPFNCPNDCENGACIGGGNENASLTIILKDKNGKLLSGGGASVILKPNVYPFNVNYIESTNASSQVTFNVPAGEYMLYITAGSRRWDGENCPYWLFPNTNIENQICLEDVTTKQSCTYCSPDIKNWVMVMGNYYPPEDLFEVSDTSLDKYITEAEDFCLDNLLEYAKDIYNGLNSEDKLKKCKGLFLIEGLGKRAEFMQGYFTPKACCDSNEFICDDSAYFGICNSTRDPIETFNSLAQELTCGDQNIPSWMSDEDMSSNTCGAYPYPAHVSLNILKTGVCQDYSIALTTLLRKAGYTSDEVMSINGIYHMFNFVKFPGDIEYHIVDTVGNQVNWSENWDATFNFYQNIPFEGGDHIKVNSLLTFDHCIMPIRLCYNDLGKVDCPDNSEIIECKNTPVKHIFNLDSCQVHRWWGKFTCDECWYEFKSEKNVEGCCREYFKLFGITVGRKTWCASGNMFDFR